jgi:hypothetical protein
MKLYGYSEEERAQPEPIPVELAEVTLVATASELREMAEFLLFCASEMNRMGSKYDHIHLSDTLKQFQSSPHFVVARPSE